MTSTDTHGPNREREQLSSTRQKQEHRLYKALLMHGILVRLPKIIAVTNSSSHQQEGPAQVDKPHSTRNTAHYQNKTQWMRPAAFQHLLSRRSNACGAKRNATLRIIQQHLKS